MAEMTIVQSGSLAMPDLGIDALAAAAEKHLERIKSFAISKQEDADFLADQGAASAAISKELEGIRDAHVRPLNTLVGSINAEFKRVSGHRDEIKIIVAESIKAWNKKCSDEARARQSVLDEAARVTRGRLAVEAKAAEDAANALEAAAMQNPDTTAADVAFQAAQEQRSIASHVAAQATQTTVAPVLIARTKGVTIRENWQGALENKQELCKHIIAHPEDEDLLMLNPKAAKSKAEANKGRAPIPGFRIWDEQSVLNRKRA